MDITHLPTRALQWLAVATVALTLSACGGGGSTKDQPTLDNGTTDGADSLSTGLGNQKPFTGDPLDNPNSLLSRRVVYFDFNSSQVVAEDRAVVEAHANYLLDNPAAKLVLEGHADERGTREYNLALGEERSVSVQQIMELIGVEPQQLELVSFGEERPVDEGHDESAWTRNRRVELNYLSN